MVGTGAYVYTRPIPMALKVIQARMVAQAGVVAAVCIAGAVTMISADEPQAHATSSWQVREFNADGSSQPAAKH